MTEWEWIIVTNNGGRVPVYVAHDARVRLVPGPEGNYREHGTIGALKRRAAERASKPIIVELDADDMLTPDALSEVMLAFCDPQVQMVYSNSAEFEDGTWKPHEYGAYWGWQAREFCWYGHDLREMVAWKPSAQMMRSVHFAPNHIRAWRQSAYMAVGGHDTTIKTGDDHDLCMRFYITYGAKGIRHIDKCLYLYRLHGDNSSVTHNADVLAQSERNYIRHRTGCVIRWAADEGLAMLDLGGRFNAWDGFTTVDLHDADVNCDLNGRWAFEDGSVGVIRAAHIFEHLRDPIHTMNEAYRVLAPGGWLLAEVPSTDGRGAFQDPTHVSWWNSNSFWYYTNQNWARFIQPAYTGRFQTARVVTFYPTEFEQLHQIPIVQADLIALKPGYDRPVGEVLI
jgi:SAM-dependent methyltransferase